MCAAAAARKIHTESLNTHPYPTPTPPLPHPYISPPAERGVEAQGQWGTDELTPENEDETAAVHAEISAAASWKRRSLTPITGAKNIVAYLGQIPPGVQGRCSDNGASAPGGGSPEHTPFQTDAPGARISLPCRTPGSWCRAPPQGQAQTSDRYTRNRFEDGVLPATRRPCLRAC